MRLRTICEENKMLRHRIAQAGHEADVLADSPRRRFVGSLEPEFARFLVESFCWAADGDGEKELRP